MDPSDLVWQLVWEFMSGNGEEVKRHEYPNEDQIPLRMLL